MRAKVGSSKLSKGGDVVKCFVDVLLLMIEIPTFSNKFQEFLVQVDMDKEFRGSIV